MNKSNYNIRENIGALTAGVGYSGFWTLVLAGNMINLAVAGLAAANFYIVHYGYNSIKNKEKDDFENRDLLKERTLDRILED